MIYLLVLAQSQETLRSGNIKTLPASYVPQIPFTKIYDIARTIQRGINHTMKVVQEKF